jgi:hypothetical protein
LALFKKSGGLEKSWRFTENQADLQNLGALEKNSEETAQAALLLWADSLPYFTGCSYRADMPKFTRKSKN